MERVFGKGYSLVDACAPVYPATPVTAFYLTNKYANFKRELAFPETADKEVWDLWRHNLRKRLNGVFCLDKLGKAPTPDVHIIEEVECDGYIRRKITYETLPGNSVTAYLLMPDGIVHPVPAVLCIHGHFKGGKDSVVFPEKAPGVAFGHEFAKQGFIVLAPDNAGMADVENVGTNERDVPVSYVTGQREGGCNLLFRRLNHVGLDITGFRIFELLSAINIISDMAEVDNTRIGCAGLSGGCWLSQVLSALDTRIKAVILSGYFTTFVQTAWIGHCVCHHPFGIGNICDMPDLSALIAPRPQFIESGRLDESYPAEPAYSMVKRAYSILGASQNIDIDIFEGGHRFNGVVSIPWMVRYLRNI